MENLFLILFLASLTALIVGLLVPSVFSRLLKGHATRKGVAVIFGVSTIVFFFLFGITTDTKKPSVASTTPSPITSIVPSPSEEPEKQDEIKLDTAKTTPKATPVVQKPLVAQPTITPVASQEPKPIAVIKKTGASILPSRTQAQTIAKAAAEAKWKTDYTMVKWDLDQAMQAYDKLAKESAHLDIMQSAISKWKNDYVMVEWEYENQVKAYESLH